MPSWFEEQRRERVAFVECLRMDELPPGVRFYPTEEELVSFYLKNKLDGIGEQEFQRVIPVVDIYENDPWHLPQISGELCHGDPEQWFFFCPRQEREARGGRPNRITNTGYWKATGSPGCVFANNRVIGMKKTMVFYEGKAPSGKKTKWKMIEYKAVAGEASSTNTSTPTPRHEYSVCRVYVNSGSLRAFDRRPSGPTTSDQVQGNVASSSYQNLNNVVGSANSTDTPPTGDHVSSNENAGEENWVMDPLWQWEQLDWP